MSPPISAASGAHTPPLQWFGRNGRVVTGASLRARRYGRPCHPMIDPTGWMEARERWPSGPRPHFPRAPPTACCPALGARRVGRLCWGRRRSLNRKITHELTSEITPMAEEGRRSRSARAARAERASARASLSFDPWRWPRAFRPWLPALEYGRIARRPRRRADRRAAPSASSRSAREPPVVCAARGAACDAPDEGGGRRGEHLHAA